MNRTGTLGRAARLNYRASARTLPSADLPEWTVTRSIPMPGDTAPMTHRVIGVLFFRAAALLALAKHPQHLAPGFVDAGLVDRGEQLCADRAVDLRPDLFESRERRAAAQLVRLGQQQMRSESAAPAPTRASADRNQSAGGGHPSRSPGRAAIRASLHSESAVPASAAASLPAPWRSRIRADRPVARRRSAGKN